MLKNKLFNDTLNLDNNNLEFIPDGLLRDYYSRSNNTNQLTRFFETSVFK